MGQEFVVPSFNTNRYYNKNTENIAVLPTGLTAGMVIYVQSDGTLDGSLNHFWDNTNNRLGLGTNAPGVIFDVAVQGASIVTSRFTSYATNGAGAELRLREARGTLAAPTISINGDDAGYLRFEGYDGAAFQPCAQISASIDGAPGASDMPGNLRFFTTADGAASLTERMRINSSGIMLVNGTTAYGRAGQLIEVDVSANNGGGAFNTWSAAAASHASIFDFNRSKSSTVGTHTVVASGDSLGYIVFRGSDGSAFQDAASIVGEVDGAPGASDMPGRLVFRTTPDGSATLVTRLTIDSSGRVGIGTTAPSELLEVNKSNPGITNAIDVLNVDNTNIASHARLRAATGGALGGDPLLLLTISGVSDWSVGADNDDGDKFKIGTNSAVGTGTRVTIDTSGNVGIGTSAPNANAILDVSSTTKAFMPPRMTTTQRDAIPSPTAGMVVYNSTTNKLNVYTTAWEAVTSA